MADILDKLKSNIDIIADTLDPDKQNKHWLDRVSNAVAVGSGSGGAGGTGGSAKPLKVLDLGCGGWYYNVGNNVGSDPITFLFNYSLESAEVLPNMVSWEDFIEDLRNYNLQIISGVKANVEEYVHTSRIISDTKWIYLVAFVINHTVNSKLCFDLEEALAPIPEADNIYVFPLAIVTEKIPYDPNGAQFKIMQSAYMFSKSPYTKEEVIEIIGEYLFGDEIPEGYEIPDDCTLIAWASTSSNASFLQPYINTIASYFGYDGDYTLPYVIYSNVPSDTNV